MPVNQPTPAEFVCGDCLVPVDPDGQPTIMRCDDSRHRPVPGRVERSLVFARLTHAASDAGEVWVGHEQSEFTIVLHDLRDGGLSPQIRAFGDGAGALAQAVDAGLLGVLEPNVASVDELVERLVSIGMVDQDAPRDAGDDPHEVDHSWVDDGTGHCKACGAPGTPAGEGR